MQRSEVLKATRDCADTIEAHSQVFAAFCVAMRGHTYSPEWIKSAWLMFLTGWLEAEAAENRRAGVGDVS